MWNNPLNLAIINWLAQYTAVSAHFNQFVQYLEGAYVLKGLPIMGLLWFFWFKESDARPSTRRIIMATLIGCILAVFIARIMNHITPFQPRPFANVGLLHHSYIGLPLQKSESLFDWNSFPSDHAALFFSLATGIFIISRTIGSFVFAYVLVFIALPRVYLGFHYPTDILAGAFLGIACTVFCTRKSIVSLYDAQCTRLLNRHPAGFQAVLFIISTEISMMFNDVRQIITLIKTIL